MLSFAFLLQVVTFAVNFVSLTECVELQVDSRVGEVKTESPVEEYESVINQYTKYLSSIPKSVKEEEMRYLEESAKIDKEIAQLRHKKVLLRSKLSDASKEHQDKKAFFEQKLGLLSGFNKKHATERGFLRTKGKRIRDKNSKKFIKQ